MSIPPRRRYSPASLRLAAVGITHERLAKFAGVGRSTITAQLSGHHTVQPYLYSAVRRAGGPELADELRILLDPDLDIEAAS